MRVCQSSLAEAGMNSLQVYAELWPYLKQYKLRFFVGFVLGLLFAATGPALMFLLDRVLQKVFSGRGYQHEFWQVVGYSLLIPALYLVRGLCDFFNKYFIAGVGWRAVMDLRNRLFAHIHTLSLDFFTGTSVGDLVRGLCDFFNKYFIAGVGLRAVMDLRNRLFAHIHTLSLDFFTGTSVGDLVSRITNDAVYVQRAVSGAAADLLKEPFVFVGFLVGMLVKDPLFTLATMILFPICLVPIAVYGRKVKMSTKSSQENLSSLVSLLNASFSGVRIVKAFCMEQAEIAQFRKSSKKLFRYFMRVVMGSELVAPIIEFISALVLPPAFVYAFERGMDWRTFSVLGFGLVNLYSPIKKL